MHNFHRMKINNSVCAYAAKTILIVAQLIELSSDWDWDWDWDLSGTPQLLPMKEHSDNKVPLVKMSSDDPLNPSSINNNLVDSENNNQGVSNMIKEKFMKNP